MSSLKANEYLKLAKASTTKIKGIARSLANPKGLLPRSRVRPQKSPENTTPSEEKNFYKRLGDQLHAVEDWIGSLKSARDVPISTLEKLLNNLERLCEPQKSSKSQNGTSIRAYSALKRLNFSSDGATSAIIKLGQANSESAIKRQDALLRILASISLSPSPELIEPPYNPENSEPEDQPMDSWFKPRLDALYKVFSSLGLFEVPEQSIRRSLTSRLCLANSKMVNNKTLKVSMLLGSGDKSRSFCHWRETQIEISPKEKGVNFLTERIQGRDRELNTEANPDLPRYVTAALNASGLYEIIAQNEPTCLCFEVHDQYLIRGLIPEKEKDINNYIDDTPSICLDQLLTPKAMEREKRLFVSYLLIRAFWQCYGTKWMDEAWTKVRIHFMYTMNASLRRDKQLYAHQPFLATDFVHDDPNEVPGQTDNANQGGNVKKDQNVRPAIRQPKIRALGIMLLEIELGSTIESHLQGDFLGSNKQPNAYTNLNKAQILVEDDALLGLNGRRKTIFRVREIIRKCLNGKEFSACKDDESEKSIILRDILTPIEKLLTELCGKDLKDVRYQPINGLKQNETSANLGQGMKQALPTPEVLSVDDGPDGSDTSESALENHPNQTLEEDKEQYQTPISATTSSVANTNGTGAKLFDIAEGASLEDITNSDDWLKNVDFIRDDCFKSSSKSERIKIAILDTGLYYEHPFYLQDEVRRPRIKARESFFDATKKETDIPCVDSPKKTKDTHGHGTHIAGIIMQVAPNADLYIGRVVKGNEMSPGDADRISKGIRWAISMKVDIISLSLGFNSPQTQIRKAIKDAEAQDILIFASASNGGANNIDPISFPARLYTKVFCIHASDSYGNKIQSSPPPQDGKENFSVVGAGIESAWPPAAMERKSGTSFSTPIAAAIAALVLEYVNQRNEDCPGSPGKECAFSEDNRKTLHTREGMAAVLRKMGTPPAEGFLYLRPWVLWGEKGRRNDHNTVLTYLKELVKNI